MKRKRRRLKEARRIGEHVAKKILTSIGGGRHNSAARGTEKSKIIPSLSRATRLEVEGMVRENEMGADKAADLLDGWKGLREGGGSAGAGREAAASLREDGKGKGGVLLGDRTPQKNLGEGRKWQSREITTAEAMKYWEKEAGPA